MILTYFWAEDERNCDCSAELSPQESQEEFQVRSNVREYDCTEIDEKMRLISMGFFYQKGYFWSKCTETAQDYRQQNQISCLQTLK